MTVKISLMREINEEHEKQSKKWGPEHDDEHSHEEFCEIIKVYLAKAENDGDWRRRLIQIAAIACSAVESIDRA